MKSTQGLISEIAAPPIPQHSPRSNQGKISRGLILLGVGLVVMSPCWLGVHFEKKSTHSQFCLVGLGVIHVGTGRGSAPSGPTARLFSHYLWSSLFP